MKRRFTFNELNEIFSYDPETGVLRWKKRIAKHCPIGKIAGTVAKNYSTSYVVVAVSGKKLQVHRIAWLLTNGKWPKKNIDHIDGNGLNNRIKNLRDVDCKANSRNTKLPSNNKSGCVGVCWCKTNKVWLSYIRNGTKVERLGNFKIKSHAVTARKEAEVRLGYHPNHGRRK